MYVCMYVCSEPTKRAELGNLNFTLSDRRSLSLVEVEVWIPPSRQPDTNLKTGRTS